MTFQRPAAAQADLQLFLVRHATHADMGLRLTGRAAGVPLTDAGRAEAAALGRRLQGAHLSEIHCSPRDRTRQTAEAIARATGAELRIEDALDEIDFGEWTGAAFETLGGADWDRWNTARSTARCPGGESMAEAADRIAAHVDRLVTTCPGGRIALVTHSDMIRALVARCLGLSLDNLLRFEIAPASVSRIVAGPGRAKVLSLNETGTNGTEE